MKILTVNRKITLSILMMVLICGLSGVSYGEDAITILSAECGVSDVIPGFGFQVTVKGTIRANRDVKDVKGWLTINGKIIDPFNTGGYLFGDLSAGHTKSFNIIQVAEVSNDDRCGVHFKFREVNPPPETDPTPEQQPTEQDEPGDEQPGETSKVCQVGDVLSPGESCTYPGTNVKFSVNNDGSAQISNPPQGLPSFIKLLFGEKLRDSVSVNTTIDGKVYNFAAKERDDASWIIQKVGSASVPEEPKTDDDQQPDPPKKPDLVVTSVRVSNTTLVPGEGFTLSVTPKNQGTGESTATTLRYYRSTNNIISSNDTEVGSDSVSVLEANQTNDKNLSLSAPTLPGTYYYGACVDSLTNERDTDNNCSATVTVTVVSTPDLVVEAVQAEPATVAPGEQFRLYATLKNQGTGESAATIVRYYRSSNDTISTRETQLRSANRDPLAADGTIRRYLTVTAPTTPGTYYYGVCVDSVSNESNTTNNCSGAVSVTVTAPPVVSEDVNEDGVVDVQDLVYVAQRYGQTSTTTADVNDDGVVNINDLILVAAVLDADAAAAPSLHPDALDLFSVADVKLWLSQAHQRDLMDPGVRRGIQFLEQLLASMVPEETALLANYPNPFNPETWIPYQLAKDADVTLTIYAVDGQIVRRLALGHQPAGMYQNRSRAVYWDGCNALGECVASSVYFYTLTAGDFTATRKMLILK